MRVVVGWAGLYTYSVIAPAGNWFMAIAVFVIDVSFINLKALKQTNESYGHGAGDTYPRVDAARLRVRLCDRDTAAKISGDEFIVALDNASERKEVTPTTHRLIGHIALPIRFGEHQFFG